MNPNYAPQIQDNGVFRAKTWQQDAKFGLADLPTAPSDAGNDLSSDEPATDDGMAEEFIDPALLENLPRTPNSAGIHVEIRHYEDLNRFGLSEFNDCKFNIIK